MGFFMWSNDKNIRRSMGTCLNVPIDVFRVQQVIVELHLINTIGGKGMRFNISEATTKNFHF